MKAKRTDPNRGDSLQLADLTEDGRRSEPRWPLTRRIAILPCHATTDWKFINAELTDSSRHGLGLVSTLRFAPAQQFLAKLRIGKRTLLLIYTVRHSTPVGSRFRVGAEFSGLTASSFAGDFDQVVSALKVGASDT
jgi:hypothetical protein